MVFQRFDRRCDHVLRGDQFEIDSYPDAIQRSRSYVGTCDRRCAADFHGFSPLQRDACRMGGGGGFVPQRILGGRRADCIRDPFGTANEITVGELGDSLGGTGNVLRESFVFPAAIGLCWLCKDATCSPSLVHRLV